MSNDIIDRAMRGEWIRGEEIRLFAEEYVKKFGDKSENLTKDKPKKEIRNKLINKK